MKGPSISDLWGIAGFGVLAIALAPFDARAANCAASGGLVFFWEKTERERGGVGKRGDIGGWRIIKKKKKKKRIRKHKR